MSIMYRPLPKTSEPFLTRLYNMRDNAFGYDRGMFDDIIREVKALYLTIDTLGTLVAQLEKEAEARRTFDSEAG